MDTKSIALLDISLKVFQGERDNAKKSNWSVQGFSKETKYKIKLYKNTPFVVSKGIKQMRYLKLILVLNHFSKSLKRGVTCDNEEAPLKANPTKIQAETKS